MCITSWRRNGCSAQAALSYVAINTLLLCVLLVVRFYKWEDPIYVFAVSTLVIVRAIRIGVRFARGRVCGAFLFSRSMSWDS